MCETIDFVGEILDNVHGFIPYTAAEKQIMDTALFKRLQGIKQLSVVNWVFPGSEHTRFIHSLGVMHIADRIAFRLGLSIKERKILRFAGLLHDIGHYPLSHVCEFPYKKSFALLDLSDDQEYCQEVNNDVISKIKGFTIDVATDQMTASFGCHHEAIGSIIIESNEEIRKIVIEECNDELAPETIANIISGNVEGSTDPLLVQIIHSELDADGIDYLMRDATFSGTSFGSFEIDQLIRCLTYGTQGDKRILCVTPKGIPAADQYLINKFFSYSQVVCNKHIVISEWMAEQVVNWMQNHGSYFPKSSDLESWAKKASTEYLNFNDNLFWASLERILTSELIDLVPHYIKTFCDHLLHHNELVYVDGSEKRIVSNNASDIRKLLETAEICTDANLQRRQISILSTRPMSKQVPIEEFKAAIEKKRELCSDITPDNMPELLLCRLMEGICVKDYTGSLHLLCDDPRSLMQTMYNMTLVILRTYEFPVGEFAI